MVPEAQRSDAGKNIVITVNPASGMQLKEGSLVAKYTLEGREISYTMVKNSAGQYVLTMPAANVTFQAQFETATQQSQTSTATGAPSGSASTVQATGALAVAVSCLLYTSRCL